MFFCFKSVIILESLQEIAMVVFSLVVQGILVAGLSTYANQIVKQSRKEE
ncbi:MAG: phage holin family protein [Blautia sp.]